MIIFALAVGFLTSFLGSCNYSDENKVADKDLELQKQALALKEKELELKEKQLALDSAAIASRQNAKETTTKQTEGKASNAPKKDLPLNAISVPTTVTKLISLLGKYTRYQESLISTGAYIWNFKTGLEIYADSGGSEEEMKQIIDRIIFSVKSDGSTPSCPFGFVLNQTTFDEVNTRFKLKKTESFDGDEFKARNNNMWSYFEFKNKILVRVTIASWEQDMTG